MTRSRNLACPEPGYFVTRLVKGGPLVPARIYRPCPFVLPPVEVLPGGYHYNDLEPGDVDPADWCAPLDRSRPLHADINGNPCDVQKVWTGARFSKFDEWRYLTALGDYARQAEPSHPLAQPTQAVDLRSQASLF